jgi:hypothetical protein
MTFVGRGDEIYVNWVTVRCSGLNVDQLAVQFTRRTGIVRRDTFKHLF